MIKKKYLGILSTALTMCLVGCTEYDGVYEGYSADYLRRSEEYRAAFIKEFGQFSSDQTWGFGDMQVTRAGLSTRGATEPNINQWADPNQLNLVVPGYPDSEGTFHIEGGKFENNKKLEDIAGKTGNNPAGDVTDEEIQYVSRWFREHKNPQSVKVHWTDFFVQSISADWDRELDGNGYCNGAIIDEVPIQVKNSSTGKYENWINNGDLQTAQIEYYSDMLEALSFDGVSYPQNADSWTHIYNFNHGNSNFNPVSEETDNRVINLFTSSGTEDFSYRSSYDDKRYNNYVIVPLVFDIPQTGHCAIHDKNCTKHHYEGYYLAFDYETHKVDAEGKLYEKNCDGFYSNWILKITPALHQVTETSSRNWRVMCEDLGAIGDYDFNDVVFDISYEQYYDNGDQKTDAIITLQAAGGTLPVCLARDDSNHEVHHLFGQDDTHTPINVGFKGIKCHVAIFRVKDVETTNPNDILIMVHNGASQEAVYSLQAEKGEVPQKICVPASVPWTDEGIRITNKYPFFTQWVSDLALDTADAQDCFGWSSATVNPLGGADVTEYDEQKVVALSDDVREVNTITYSNQPQTLSKKMKVWHSYSEGGSVAK